MIATVTAVVFTHNLAIGVLLGVHLSGIFFAAKIAELYRATGMISADGHTRTYRVEGQLFYGSVEDFMAASGLVAYLCRSKCLFRLPGVRRPRGFSRPMLNVGDVGCRSR
jgi:MFS superfamily sulfate permease-like transporter